MAPSLEYDVTDQGASKAMKTIQILGTGCAKCNRLSDAAEQAAGELGLEYRLEKITDMMRFADFGVMMTPALAVDGDVKVSGRVPSQDELKQMLA
jgi:small redox-active disulfide protein 2